MAMKDRQRRAMFARLNTLNVRANRLPVQVSIIVPSTTARDIPLKSPAFARRVDSEKRFFSKTFGGDTAIRGEGNFILTEKGKDRLIKEKNLIVESSTTPKIFNSKRKVLIQHLKQRQKEWKQNSIFYKIEGESFIFPRQKFIPHDKTKRKILVT